MRGAALACAVVLSLAYVPGPNQRAGPGNWVAAPLTLPDWLPQPSPIPGLPVPPPQHPSLPANTSGFLFAEGAQLYLVASQAESLLAPAPPNATAQRVCSYRTGGTQQLFALSQRSDGTYAAALVPTTGAPVGERGQRRGTGGGGSWGA
jgi:hypothetical protein